MGFPQVRNRASRDLSRFGTLLPWTFRSTPNPRPRCARPARLGRRPRPHRRHPARGPRRGPPHRRRARRAGRGGAEPPRRSASWRSSSGTCPPPTGTARRPAFAAAPNRPTAGAIPADPDDNVVAVFSSAARKGRWRAGRRIHAYAVFGSVEIDLSEAIFEYQQVVIKAISVFGNVEVRVPENVSLRGTGGGVLGNFEVDTLDSADPDAPSSTSTAGPSSATSRRGPSAASSSRTSSTGCSARSTGVCASTWIVDGCESGACPGGPDPRPAAPGRRT